MGTSKTKIGRKDSNNPPVGGGTFKTAKTLASKYFSGNVATFATAMKATIDASGVDYFVSKSSKTKSFAFAQLIFFVIGATNIGIKQQATRAEISYAQDSQTKDILYQYVNTIYPDAITDNDIFAREQLLHVADAFVPLFDEKGFFNATDIISTQLIINMIISDLTKEIFGDFLSVSPGSVENDNPDLVQNKSAGAMEDIRSRLEKNKKAFNLDINDKDSIVNYRENLKKAVVLEYYMEEETGE